MSSTKNPAVPETSPRPGESVEELAADIRDTRRRLAATVEALAERADLGARARAAMERRRARLREKTDGMKDRLGTLTRRLRHH
jgi:hypothetical protein